MVMTSSCSLPRPSEAVARRRRARYAERVRAWESLTSAVTPYVLDAVALGAGERIIDIGCGIGAATLAAADAVGARGAAIGIDIAAPVIAAAADRVRDADVRNVGFQVADAQEGSFSGAPFDVAMSQFGVMFFDDPVAAFGNIRRQLVIGGRLCFSTWGAAECNPWSFASTVADLLPVTSSARRTGPFSLASAALIDDLLHQAGFTIVRVTEHVIAVDLPKSSVVDADELTLMGIPANRLSEARARVDEWLSPYLKHDGRLLLPITFLVTHAR
jgi:ubiquinone/menaquinone biosynthesis C-methylase UbiE